MAKKDSKALLIGNGTVVTLGPTTRSSRTAGCWSWTE